MVLTTAIQKARLVGATREVRENYKRVQLRMDEMAKVIGIPERYERNDRQRNLEVETAFVTAYQLVDGQAEKDAILHAYMLWEKDERGEKADVHGATEEASAMLARDNDVWLGGQDVPASWLNDGCGPTGRAA